MSHARQLAFEKKKRGGILLCVVALHVAILYGLAVHKLRRTHSRNDAEISVDIIWDKAIPKTPRPEPAQPRHDKPAARIQAAPVTVPPPQDKAIIPAPTAPTPPDAKASKPLDLLQILKDVGPETRKFDAEHAGEHTLQAEPGEPSFESKLDKALANATGRPKFYEGARVEEISSAAQLDADIRIYKITTFAGTYCVTYHGTTRPDIGSCPIRF